MAQHQKDGGAPYSSIAVFVFAVSSCILAKRTPPSLDLASHRAYEGENSVRLIGFLRVRADVP